MHHYGGPLPSVLKQFGKALRQALISFFGKLTQSTWESVVRGSKPKITYIPWLGGGLCGGNFPPESIQLKTGLARNTLMEVSVDVQWRSQVESL